MQKYFHLHIIFLLTYFNVNVILTYFTVKYTRSGSIQNERNKKYKKLYFEKKHYIL